MPDAAHFGLFLMAAFLLAITPGPGIFYVLARSLRGGHNEGYVSALGTALGGLCHMFAAALGLSAILAASAAAFHVVRYLGAAYLLYLGVKTLLAHDEATLPAMSEEQNKRRVFYQGVVTELLNPKTALFFLSFLPQFINVHGRIVPQFVLLGSLSVLLNTSADFVVAALAGPIGQRLKNSAKLRRRQRIFSGGALIGLGVYVAASGEKT